MVGTDIMTCDTLAALIDWILDTETHIVTWQRRPLDLIYPLIFFDALREKIRRLACSATRSHSTTGFSSGYNPYG